MKVSRIAWADVRKARLIEFTSRYELPRVYCDTCGETWGVGLFYYPAFNFEFFKEDQYNFAKTVSVEEFRRIVERICTVAGRRVNLIPGASLGTLGGRVLTKKLDDFIWGTITVPQLSRRACALLEQDGVKLQTVECPIECRGESLATHMAVQLEPVRLLADEYLEACGYRYCPMCNNFTAPTPPPAEPYLIRKAMWPERSHLVMSQETLDVFASAELMEVVERHKLTGVRFLECGRFV